MAGKLVVLFDGPWNTPEDQTNVTHLAQLLGARDIDGNEQLPFYDKSFGTHALDRLRGDIFDYGLSDNIRQACAWLAARYRPDDELFFIGFGRGVNETVDDAVWKRRDAHTDYRPPTAAAQRT